jgi:hypothetical protein
VNLNPDSTLTVVRLAGDSQQAETRRLTLQLAHALSHTNMDADTTTAGDAEADERM